MNGRQKMEAAFSQKGSSEIPVVTSCYEDIYRRDHWDQLTKCPWWYLESPDIEQQMEWRREVIASTGEDWFRLSYCPTKIERLNTKIEARKEGVFRVNRLTGKYEALVRSPVGGWHDLTCSALEPFAESTDDIDKLVPLPSQFDPNDVATQGRDELAKRMIAEFGERLCPNYRVSTPLLSCSGLWGFEGMMEMVVSSPDLVKYASERYMELVVRRIRKMALMGAECMWIVDAFSDLIGPATFESIHLPYVRRVMEELHNYGIKGIYFFTGNPAGKWDLILSVGADAFAFEESKKGFVNDIEDIVARVKGRWTVFGNLDPYEILEKGTEAQLRSEIARQIAAGRKNNNRFVMSLGSPITPDTSAHRVRLYCDLSHELGL